MIKEILNYLTGNKEQKQNEADRYMQYWDKVRRMDAMDIPVPQTKAPDLQTQNSILGIVPSSKMGLGKMISDMFNKDNKIHSPVPEAQAAEAIPPGYHVMPDGSLMKNEDMVTPTPAPNKIDFTGYTSKTLPGGKLPEVPKNLTDLFFQEFANQNEATPAAAVTVGENAGFNPNAVGTNTNGTKDYGLMQINSGTFDGLKKRRPAEMAAIGITADTPYDVLFDPVVNMKVAKLVRKDEQWAGQQPFDQWYGWKDPPLGKGINLQEMINKLSK